MTSMASRLRCGLTLPILLGVSDPALAVAMDLREGVTHMSQRILALHHLSLWVCVVVGVLGFSPPGRVGARWGVDDDFEVYIWPVRAVT